MSCSVSDEAGRRSDGGGGGGSIVTCNIFWSEKQRSLDSVLRRESVSLIGEAKESSAESSSSSCMCLERRRSGVVIAAGLRSDKPSRVALLEGGGLSWCLGLGLLVEIAIPGETLVATYAVATAIVSARGAVALTVRCPVLLSLEEGGSRSGDVSSRAGVSRWRVACRRARL
jgi:hypothetical protein